VTKSKENSESLAGITRRDFIGTTLIGAGAALLSSPCPAAATGLGAEWTGYGGVGDYRFSNGNTADVVKAAHRIRDGAYDAHAMLGVIETDEVYDLIIIGAGFAGMASSYEFAKQKPNGKCLILDNHPMFGGEAKQNDFDVDGYRLTGPQGSNLTAVPQADWPKKFGSDGKWMLAIWQDLGLPTQFEFAEPEGTHSKIAFSKESYECMKDWDHVTASTGYFFKNQITGNQGLWLKDIWREKLARAPLREKLRNDLLAWRDSTRRYHEASGESEWLDSMTYGDFVTKVMGLDPEVLSYADGYITTAISGTSSGISAYAAQLFGMPGVSPDRDRGQPKVDLISFPGGNSAVLRHFVKAVLPHAIEGGTKFPDVENNSVNLSLLDQPGSQTRMRLRATAVQVSHEGTPSSAESVSVIYERGGRLYRVRSKAAILAIGGWVSKRIVTDLPSDYRAAFASFLHGPMLVVNVALRNWQFMNDWGVSAIRWFDGLGFFGNIRQPMIVGQRPAPLSPDKPAILTLYVSFPNAALPLAAQGSAGRAVLYGTSFAAFERQILDLMRNVFAKTNFDAERDVAAIVLNRWGHAYVSPQPGFFFGLNGQPAPRDLIRKRHGRISFAHAELGGVQSWPGAIAEGYRAVKQAMEVM
jgi:spermidine dehydrogenase